MRFVGRIAQLALVFALTSCGAVQRPQSVVSGVRNDVVSSDNGSWYVVAQEGGIARADRASLLTSKGFSRVVDASQLDTIPKDSSLGSLGISDDGTWIIGIARVSLRDGSVPGWARAFSLEENAWKSWELACPEGYVPDYDVASIANQRVVLLCADSLDDEKRRKDVLVTFSLSHGAAPQILSRVPVPVSGGHHVATGSALYAAHDGAYAKVEFATSSPGPTLLVRNDRLESVSTDGRSLLVQSNLGEKFIPIEGISGGGATKVTWGISLLTPAGRLPIVTVQDTMDKWLRHVALSRQGRRAAVCLHTGQESEWRTILGIPVRHTWSVGTIEVFEPRGDKMASVWATGWDEDEDWGNESDGSAEPKQIGFLDDKTLFVNNHSSLLLYSLP